MKPQFEPLNPKYEAVVKESFARQAAMATLGVSLQEVGPGWVQFLLEKREELTQQHGFIHAGVVASALDSACGYASLSLMPEGAAILTAEYKVNLLRPAEGSLAVNGWVVKPGRTLTVAQGEAIDEGGKLIANMTGTLIQVVDRDLES